MTPWLVAGCCAFAVLLAWPPRPDPLGRLGGTGTGSGTAGREPTRAAGPERRAGWLHRHRVVWSVLGAAAGWIFVGGPAGPVAGALAGAATWWGIARAEPATVRRERERLRRELPHVVALYGSALAGGVAPADAVAAVCRAVPGPAAGRLEPVSARLALGADPTQVWADLGRDPELAPLGRTMVRAYSTGASVVDSVQRLADDLTDRARSEVEDRARAVGVKAAVPLGLCLLPAFVLIGIVPLVVGLLAQIGWR